MRGECVCLHCEGMCVLEGHWVRVCINERVFNRSQYIQSVCEWVLEGV